AINGPGSYAVIYPLLGITATPVIDLDRNTMYVLVMSNNPTIRRPGGPDVVASHTLFAVDIRSGEIKNRTSVYGSTPGQGDGSINGVMHFDSNRHVGRPGLLLLNGVVYVAFGGNGEIDPYHGWVFGYEVETLKPAGLFCTTPSYKKGGVWQSGNGLAADDSYIYFTTGNGGDNGGAYIQGKLGESVVKLSTVGHSLKQVDFFTPFNQQCLDTCDLD